MQQDDAAAGGAEALRHREDTGEPLALIVMAGIALTGGGATNAVRLGAALNLDPDTAAFALAHLADVGFLSAAERGAKPLGRKALRRVLWTDPHCLTLTPAGLAWAAGRLEPLAPLIVAAGVMAAPPPPPPPPRCACGQSGRSRGLAEFERLAELHRDWLETPAEARRGADFWEWLDLREASGAPAQVPDPPRAA